MREGLIMTIDIQELKEVACAFKANLDGEGLRKQNNPFMQTHILGYENYYKLFTVETVLTLFERIENLETTVKFFEALTRDQQNKIDELQAKPKRSNIPCVAMDGSNPFNVPIAGLCEK